MPYNIMEIDGVVPENRRFPVSVHPATHELSGIEHTGQLRDDQIPSSIMRDTEHQNDPHTMLIDGRDVSTDGGKLDTIEFGAEVNNLTDTQASSLTSGAHSNWHNHDQYYYRKTELYQPGESQVNWVNLINVPLTFPAIAHTHDDRYYTETEIDTLLTSYYTKYELDVGQLDNRYYTQTLTNSLFYSKLELDSGQLDNRYFTESEINTIISLYYTKLDLDNGQLDNRYFTESEITTNYYSKTQLDNGQLDNRYLTAVQIVDDYYSKVQLDAGQLDNRYFTETEINNRFTLYYTQAQLNNGILDNRYYTETEIDTTLAGYYTILQLNAGQLDNRYFTETEIVANYYSKNQLDTGQLNNIYYTEGEIDSTFYSKIQLDGGQLDNRYYTKTLIDSTFYSKIQLDAGQLNSIYYTETELDNKFNLYYSKTQLDAGQLDNRYYTENEIDVLITASTFGIAGSVQAYADLPNIQDTGLIYIVRTTVGLNQEGFYRWDGTGWTFLANNTGSQTHNDLTGLNNGDYKHLTSTQFIGLTTGINTSLHTHDDRYFTETEINTKLASYYTQAQLNGGQLNSLYYTKTQLQTSGQSIVDWGNVANKPTLYTPSIHNHDDLYYTETELNAGQLDTRYYTESEVDTKIANIKTAGVKAVVDQYDDLLSITDEIPGTVYIVREKNGVVTGTPQLYTNTGNTIIHMRFDGNTNDDIGHINTGGGTITYEPGKVAQAGVFNNAYRTYANAADLNVTNQFSAGVWLYPTQLDPTKSYSLFDKYPTNGSQSGWGLIIEDGGKMHIWAMGPNQPLVKVVTYSKLRVNQWTHVGLSFDGTMIKLWKNAVIVAELEFNGDIGANTAPIDIGRYYNDYLYAKLDDLFYTRDLLTATDFMRIVNGGAFANYNSEGFWMWDGSVWTFLVQNMSGIYHNELLGVNREEFMHLTKNEYRLLTQSQDASSIHNHDGRYFTEAEIDVKLALKSDVSHNHDSSYYTKTQLQTSGQSIVDWGNVANKPTIYTPAAHNHDDRYYTISQSDLLFSPTIHNHDTQYFTQLQITSNYYSKNQLDTGQLDNRYYTESEMNILLAGKAATTHTHDDRYFTETEITTFLAGKAAVTHTHDDRYYTEAEIDAKLALKSDTTHNHDSSYYTQTQLNSSSGTSGASRIGVSLIGGMVATNVQSALQELKTSISATTVTLNQAYTAGRSIAATSGPVKIDSTGATTAPLEITNLATTPTAGLTGGQMAIINNELYIYNLAKSKWLTPTKVVTFGRTGAVDGSILMSTGTVKDDASGYKMAKNGTVVSITLASVNSVTSKEVYLRVNASVVYTMLTNSSGDINDTSVNINFNAGDIISIYASSTGSALSEVTSVVEFAWRA